PRVRLAARVLGHRQQARHTAPLGVLTPHQVSGSLGRDEHDVQVLRGLDLAEMDIESMREQERRAGLEAFPDAAVELLLRRVRHQDGDEVRARGRGGGFGNLQAILTGPLPAGAALAYPDDDVVAAVPEVQRMGAPLAAIAQYGDARALQSPAVDVFLRIKLHLQVLLVAGLRKGRLACIKNPAAAISRCGVFWCLVSLVSGFLNQAFANAPHLASLRSSRASRPGSDD